MKRMILSDAEEEKVSVLKNACADEIRKQLRLQFMQRPQMTEEDIVKFVFQGMLGVGHLVASPEAAMARLKEEYNDLKADETEPLIEKVSTEWVRLNLRPAKVRGMTVEEIAGNVFASAQMHPLPFTRKDVYDFCVEMKKDERMAQAAAKILDEDRLPSHSEVYWAAYHPAYRILYHDILKKNQEKAK